MNLEKHKAACGGNIGISRRGQSHLQAHLEVVAELPAAIGRIQLPSDLTKIEYEVQLGYIVGRSGVVKTSALKIQERALFALRTNRTFPSRVAPPGAVGTESTTIVIIAEPTLRAGLYELTTAWIGTLAKKEPWDPNIASQLEFDDCLQFWSTTALVFDPMTMRAMPESSWEDVLTLANSNFSWKPAA